MPDLVAVALITGTVGIAGQLLAYLGGRRHGRVEVEKLREQHAEEERRNRQGTYHRFLIAGEQRRGWMIGREEIDDNSYRSWRAEYDFALAGIRLFASKEVASSLDDLETVLGKMGDELGAGHGEESGKAAVRRVHRKYESVFALAENKVVEAMRRDVSAA